MKKLLFTLALGALTPALQAPVFAQDAAVQNLAPLADTAPFEWRLRLTAGQKFLTTTDTSSQTSQQMPAMPGAKAGQETSTQSNSKTHLVIEQNVLSSDEKGARVEVTYRELTQTNKTLQGDKVIYDSENPPAGMKGISDISQSLVGAKISYLLSASGEISEVQGVEEYLERLSAGLEKGIAGTPGAAALQKTMRASMAGFLSPDAIKNFLGTSYRTMPTQAVAPGGTWKYSLTVPVMGTSFTQSGQSTFVSRENGIVKIAQKGDFSTDAGAEFKVPLGVARDPKTPAPVTQLDLHGVSTGEVSVDEASGMTLRNRTLQTLEGEIVMSGLTGKGSTLSIPMKLRSETLATTVELKATP